MIPVGRSDGVKNHAVFVGKEVWHNSFIYSHSSGLVCALSQQLSSLLGDTGVFTGRQQHSVAFPTEM